MIITSLALLVALQAAPAAAPVLTPAETLAIRQPSEPRVSPDGRRVAFVVSEPPKGAERNRDIWMVDVGSRDVRRLTYSPKSDSSPRWSPDGRTLAFLSDRAGPPQIYLMSMAGGEPVALTDGKNGVRSFEWSPDGKAIAFVAPEPRTDAEEQQIKEKDDERVVDRDDKLARAWVVDVASKTVRQLTRDPWSVSQVSWMPKGDALVVVATDKPASDQETDRIAKVALADGAVTPIAAPRGPFGRVTISPDGGSLAYLAARVDGPSPHDLYVQAIGASAPRNLTQASLDRPIGGFTWQPDGRLLAVVEDGFKSRLSTIAADGRAAALLAAPVNPSAFSSEAGVLAFVGETTTEPPELWLSARGGPAERVTRLNADWAHPPLVAPEIFKYKSFDGAEIEAALLVPPGHQAGVKLPLVVLVHGGPTGRWSDRFESWGQLLVSRGYAVLYPNIRGSTGYGFTFLESNRADWGGGDFKDVMAGVDALIARGLADPDRLGIGGWSYGGYMAEWAITQTSRFKAAVVGAGLSDLASEYGTEQGPSYDEWFFGLPYEHLDRFMKSSPITYVKNARTPSLILQGEEDATDPQGQSDQLYRALKRYGVEAEYVLYPREPHGLREEQHLLDRLNRLIGWYEKYLK